MWAAITTILLGGVLAIWLASPVTAGHALFGRLGSEAVVAAGLAVTIAGAIALLARSGTSWFQRWGIALPTSLVAAFVAVTAIACFFAPHDATDVGLGVLLAVGAAGMNVIASHVARGTVPYDHER